MFKQRLKATEAYQELRSEHKKVYAQALNVQRKKDYQVNRIEAKFKNKIDVLVDKLSSLELEIKHTEEYLRNHGMYQETESSKETKKEGK